MNRVPLLPAFPLLLCLGAAGCVDLTPKSDPARFFRLTPLSAEAAATNGQAGPVIGVAAVQLPEYLRDNGIAVGLGGNEIVHSELSRWAEPLDEGLLRVMVMNLSGLLGSDRVVSGRWAGDGATYELQLQIDEFLVDGSGEVTLRVRWRVDALADEARALDGQKVVRRTGPPPATDISGVVGTMSQVWGELSRDLAGRLGSLK